MAQSFDPKPDVGAIDPQTVREVAEIYQTRRARGWSDFAAYHAALIVLWDRLPNQPFRVVAEKVASIVAPANRQHLTI
jgi:hypothetical protein